LVFQAEADEYHGKQSKLSHGRKGGSGGIQYGRTGQQGYRKNRKEKENHVGGLKSKLMLLISEESSFWLSKTQIWIGKIQG
jgi:hypothetical protein